MNANRTANNQNVFFQVLLLIHVLVLFFWIGAQNLNVYRFAIVGALFEILWLPVIGATILLPFASLYFWYKDKFKAKSKFLYLFLFFVSSIFYVVFLISE